MARYDRILTGLQLRRRVRLRPPAPAPAPARAPASETYSRYDDFFSSFSENSTGTDQTNRTTKRRLNGQSTLFCTISFTRLFIYLRGERTFARPLCFKQRPFVFVQIYNRDPINKPTGRKVYRK